MSTGNITTERRGHVFVVGIDRIAKRNAFDLPMWNALCLAFAELQRDDDLRVCVLHAHGEHFTGGLDLPQWGAAFSSGKWHVAEGAPVRTGDQLPQGRFSEPRGTMNPQASCPPERWEQCRHASVPSSGPASTEQLSPSASR